MPYLYCFSHFHELGLGFSHFSLQRIPTKNLGTLYTSPSYNSIRSGQARKISDTVATCWTVLLICGTAPLALAFLTRCTQNWLQSISDSDGWLGHLNCQGVCPLVSVLVLLPPFSFSYTYFPANLKNLSKF